jgi:dolichol-phosphate mannosyltransferase
LSKISQSIASSYDTCSYEKKGVCVRSIIVIPTYNERENLELLSTAIAAVTPTSHLLIVDDNSPDGTGAIADRLADEHPHIHVLHRTEKSGLGTAYVAGFRYALEQGFDYVVEMDADFSHRPEDLAQLLAAAPGADVVIGSRNIPGGRAVNWSPIRTIISRGGSWYARLLLGLPIHDCTSGFKCFSRRALEVLDLDGIRSNGYAFQVEVNNACAKAGMRFAEVPIIFPDRTRGTSKMSGLIVVEAALLVLRLKFGPYIGSARASTAVAPTPASPSRGGGD